MSTSLKKTKVSLHPATCVTSTEAEAFARATFMRVLQSWASDRLVATAKEDQKATVRKAA